MNSLHYKTVYNLFQPLIRWWVPSKSETVNTKKWTFQLHEASHSKRVVKNVSIGKNYFISNGWGIKNGRFLRSQSLLTCLSNLECQYTKRKISSSSFQKNFFWRFPVGWPQNSVNFPRILVFAFVISQKNFFLNFIIYQKMRN